MTDLYLIAHKVRGEPAFDIAIILDQLDEDGDTIWIIPTSGHRAYPWDYARLEDIMENAQCDFGTMPTSLQDHYHFDVPHTTSPLANLRLAPPQPPIVRRM